MRDFDDTLTVTRMIEARRLLDGLASSYPNRSAQLRLNLLDAQSEFDGQLIDEPDLQARIEDILELGARS